MNLGLREGRIDSVVLVGEHKVRRLKRLPGVSIPRVQMLANTLTKMAEQNKPMPGVRVEADGTIARKHAKNPMFEVCQTVGVTDRFMGEFQEGAKRLKTQNEFLAHTKNMARALLGEDCKPHAFSIKNIMTSPQRVRYEVFLNDFVRKLPKS
jgi:hypothetical protein